MDIGLVCDEGSFKLRASGVIVRDNKMLVAKSRRFDGLVHFGGHIMLGENSCDAIVREAEEELGFAVKVNKLICVNENLYRVSDGVVGHEVVFYYLLEPVGGDVPTGDFEFVETENGQRFVHQYKWIPLSESKQHNIKPNWLADMILSNKENFYYLTDQVKGYE